MSLAVLISKYSFAIAILFIFAFLFYHFFYKPRMDRIARENPNQPKNQFQQAIEDFRNSDFVKNMQEAQTQSAQEPVSNKKSKKQKGNSDYNPYATDFGSMGGDLGI